MSMDHLFDNHMMVTVDGVSRIRPFDVDWLDGSRWPQLSVGETAEMDENGKWYISSPRAQKAPDFWEQLLRFFHLTPTR